MSAGRVLVDTVAAASAVGVPAATLRWWAYSGRIERRGRDASGRTLYDLAEVSRLADESLKKVSDSTRRAP